MPTALEDFRSTMIVFMVLCTPVVAGRVWMRISKDLFRYDDATILFSYVLFIIFCGMSLASLHLGLGSIEVATSDPAAAMLAAKIFVIGALVCLLSMYAAKISLALVLFRIAGPTYPHMRWLLLGSIAVLTLWFLAIMVMWCMQCVPFSALWGEPGVCRSASWTATTAMLISAMDIAFTFFYALLPIFMLRKIRISLRTKLGVYFLLGANIVTCIVTVIRLKYVIEINNLDDHQGMEVIILEAEASVYSTIDIGLTIFLSSLAALKPLLKVALPFISGGSSGADTANSRSRLGFGHSSRNASSKGPNSQIDSRGIEMLRRRNDAIRLDDETADASSQEEIIQTPSGGGIKKQTDFTVSYHRT